MKALIFILTLFLAGHAVSGVAADNKSDSLKKVAAAKAAAKADSLKKAAKADSLKKANTHKTADTSHWSFGEWLLVFSPFVIFVLLGGFALAWLRNFKLNQALSENDLGTKPKPNDLYKQDVITKFHSDDSSSTITALLAAIPPTITETDGFRPSASRLIAFVTSILALIIGLSVTSLMIYSSLGGIDPPDLSKLSSLLLALGIGVVPYAFNKVSAAINK